jgi:hypothetical protein
MEAILINTILIAEMSLILDRGVKKVRVNMLKDGKLIGFMKPVSNLSFSFFEPSSPWEG